MPSHNCADKDIRIAPSGETIRIRFAGRIVAESSNALDLAEPGYPLRVYVPESDVDPAVLRRSERHTSCPYKGIASYYSLEADATRAENAVWFYPDPCPQVAAIKGHVAFWGPKVEILRS